ncbi:hypothetical protein [Ruminococcus sp.]|mgnify:CR=1 FL=1|uniref:hypothetical protein n=1 Tax=Ruminococcus sp. TaxID=41978 RepID=UPI002BBC4DD8|nr:hypothetical protein [Ruminococcus sp.]HNZ99471.1 hypothetical protein [Ruminococcus sp.]
MRCIYCGKTISKEEAIFKDKSTPLCYKRNADLGNSVFLSGGKKCANCKTPLELISEKNIIMTSRPFPLFSAGNGKSKGGGPLRFALYECPSCGEYHFFKSE